MPGKIFTAYHFIPAAEQYRADDLHAPVIMHPASAALPPSHPHFLADPDSDAISRENSYAENRVKWYAYKHQMTPQRTWLGFAQYRRSINFSTRSNAEIDDLASQYTAILCPPLIGAGNATRAQFKACHPAAYWDAFEHLLTTLDLPISSYVSWAFNEPLFPHGIGTMQATEFSRYMQLWLRVFTPLSAIIAPPLDPYQRRVYAFLSERFFSLYIYRMLDENPAARILPLPHWEAGQVAAA